MEVILALTYLGSHHTESIPGFASLSTGKATGHRSVCYLFLTILKAMKLYGEVSIDSASWKVVKTF